MPRAPMLVSDRRWWFVFLVFWAAVVGLSLWVHVADTREHSQGIALEGARNMFRMVVLVRSWNASHGGVYVPVTPETQPNPYLEHPRRDVTTLEGKALTLVNPAFMTRQLGELAQRQGGVVFHITSRRPIRPGNRPDDWEDGALLRFEAGVDEVWQVVGEETSHPQLRYMAPLKVTANCLSCHEKQGYREGDIRGGISVSLPYAEVEAAAAQSIRQNWVTHGAIFLLGAAVGFVLLEALRRRWIYLAATITQLEQAQGELLAVNRTVGAAREAAEAASRAKTAFLANMSHELRTPMNAITGFAYLLRREVAEPRQREMVGKIDRAARNLLTTIDQVLDLARLEAGTLVAENRPFSARDLVEREAVRVRADLGALGREDECFVEVGAEVPQRVIGDQRHMAEILQHFASNAVKFSQRGPIVLRLSCAVGTAGPALEFAVIDQGIGIHPDSLPTLFQPFLQVDDTSTRRFGGKGIGLVICRRLAQLLGGEVGVESRLGEGSRFWFRVGVGLEPGANPVAASPELDAEAEERRTGELLAFLEEDNPRAVRHWNEHRVAIRRRLAQSADEVGEAVSSCDFPRAAELLRRALGGKS